MSSQAASYGAYKRVDIETASQSKLIVMLFNGAIQRAEEAKRQMAKSNIGQVHENLLRAQDIVAELRGALNMSAGEIAVNLDRVYEYFQHLLIRANVQKDPALIDECVELMSSMRDTWTELFESTAKEDIPKNAPQINPHGSAVINIEG